MAKNQSCYALRAKPGISHVFVFFLAKELIHHLQVKSSDSPKKQQLAQLLDWLPPLLMNGQVTVA